MEASLIESKKITQINQYKQINVWIDFEVQSKYSWKNKYTTLYQFHPTEEEWKRKSISTLGGNPVSLTFTSLQDEENIQFILNETNLLKKFQVNQEVFFTDEKRSFIKKGTVKTTEKKRIPYVEAEDNKTYYFEPLELFFATKEEAEKDEKLIKKVWYDKLLENDEWVKLLIQSWESTIYPNDLTYSIDYYKEKYGKLEKQERLIMRQVMKEIVEQKAGIKLKGER